MDMHWVRKERDKVIKTHVYAISIKFDFSKIGLLCQHNSCSSFLVRQVVEVEECEADSHHGDQEGEERLELAEAVPEERGKNVEDKGGHF